MNKDQENKKVNPIIKDDNVIDIESKLNNKNNTTEIEDLYNVLENDKQYILRLINERDWWINRCAELEKYLVQFTTIGLNNAGNYNQICAQDYKILEFFKQAMKELKSQSDDNKYLDIINEQDDRLVELNQKIIDNKDKIIEDKDKRINEKDKIIESKDKEINRLRKLVNKLIGVDDDE